MSPSNIRKCQKSILNNYRLLQTIKKIRVRGLGYPERLFSSLGAGAFWVVGVGMFVVVVVVVSVVVSVSVVAPAGRSPQWGARPTRDPPWAPWVPWLARQQKVLPSPGLIIISIIIIVMIVKILIICSISNISFIYICNMNDINNIYALTIMAPPL